MAVPILAGDEIKKENARFQGILHSAGRLVEFLLTV